LHDDASHDDSSGGVVDDDDDDNDMFVDLCNRKVGFINSDQNFFQTINIVL